MTNKKLTTPSDPCELYEPPLGTKGTLAFRMEHTKRMP